MSRQEAGRAFSCWLGEVVLRARTRQVATSARMQRMCTHTHGECKGIYYFYDICVQSLDLFGLTNQNYFIRRRRRRLSAILFVGVAFAASFRPVPFALNFIQLSDLFVSQNKKELWLDEVVHEAYKGRFLSLDSRFSFPDLVKKTLLHGGWKWL